MLGRMDT